MKTIHKIVQGDCLEVMKKTPKNMIDFICSDFPYNISNNPWLTQRWDKIVKADFWGWGKWGAPEQYFDFVFKVCRDYQRILKSNGSLILFFSYRYSGWLALELEKRGLFTYRNPIILNKTNPQPQFRKNGFRSCHEVGGWLVNDRGTFSKPKTFNFLG